MSKISNRLKLSSIGPACVSKISNRLKLSSIGPACVSKISNRLRKIAAAATAVLLVVGLLPIAVFADDEPPKSVSESASGKFSQFQKPIADNNATAVCEFTIEAGDKPVCENNLLAIYLNEESAVMKIRAKETGYIWSTAAKNKENVSSEWARFSQSLAVMDFITSGGTIKRSTSQSANKKTNFTLTENGFIAELEFAEADAKLKMEVVLDGNAVKVSIPDDSIEIRGGNTVGRVLLMPFLGAVLEDSVPGYLFVPDGSGAIMNFQKGRQRNSIYQQRIYGGDSAVTKAAPLEQAVKRVAIGKISVPVFGVVHGNLQNAIAGIVTDGDEYCEINASPAGAIIDYSWIAPSFIYSELYWQSTAKSNGFNATQREPNKVNAAVEYRFLSGENADYVGMANEYRNLLAEENPDFVPNEAKPHVPLKIDAIMAEPKKSMFGNKTQIMTTLRDVDKWTDELLSGGAENLILSVYGYEQKGLNGHKVGDFSLDSKVGSKAQLRALQDKMDASGGSFYLQSDIQSGYENQVSKDVMRFGMDGNAVMEYEQNILFDKRFYANADSITKSVDRFLKAGTVQHIALQRMGSELCSDYRRGAPQTRGEVLESTKEQLRHLSENTNGLMLQAPNAYAMSCTDIAGAYDIPINNSQFEFFSQAVPFLQIVFGGYVDLFAEYQNFTANTTQDVLRLIDYNTYPSYILTEEYSNKLVDTNLNGLYSTRYNDWSPYILSNYKMLDDVLSQVSGAAALRRTSAQDGVSITEYSNGISVAVNYNDRAVNANGRELAAFSAVCFKTGGE